MKKKLIQEHLDGIRESKTLVNETMSNSEIVKLMRKNKKSFENHVKELKSMIVDVENQMVLRNKHLKNVNRSSNLGLITKAFSKGVDGEIKKNGLTKALEFDKKLADVGSKVYNSYQDAVKTLGSL